MTKNEKRVWIIGAVIAAGFAFTMMRHGRKKAPSNRPEEVATETAAPTGRGKQAPKGKKAALNAEQALAKALSEPAYAALMEMNRKQDADAAKVRAQLEKTLDAKTAQGILGDLQKTMVNGKPTAATKQLAAKYLQRSDVRAAKTMLEAHHKNNAKRGKETVDSLDPAFKSMSKGVTEQYLEDHKKKRGK